MVKLLVDEPGTEEAHTIMHYVPTTPFTLLVPFPSPPAKKHGFTLAPQRL